VASAIQLQRKELGHEGTLLIIFQFNKIIFNYFYFQLQLVDKWGEKKSFHWKKIFVVFPNPPKHFPHSLHQLLGLESWVTDGKTGSHSSNCVSHVVTCTYALMWHCSELHCQQQHLIFNFQTITVFQKNMYYFQELSQATEWTQVGPIQPAGTMLCRPAIQHGV
jgi:hypothetical protein